MKKILLTLSAGVLSVSIASAQCTPDPQYADANFGLFPDSLTFLSQGAMAGQAYSAQIDIKTFVDSTLQVANPIIPGQTIAATVTIDTFKILEIQGLPAGFTWQAGGPTFSAAGNTWANVYGTPGDFNSITPVQGCFSVSAAASAVNAIAPASGYTDFPIVVLVDAHIVKIMPALLANFITPPTWLSEVNPDFGGGPLEVRRYVLRVNGPANVYELLNTNSFDLGQSYPNPATGVTKIPFTTPTAATVEFRVFNMLGAVVFEQVVAAQPGVNDISIDVNGLTEGMYIYSVNNGERTITRKMNVK